MRAALLVFLAIVLSGCVNDPSGRSDNFFLNIEAAGEWSIEVPFPDDPLARDELRDNLRVSQGAATITWHDGPFPVHVEGNGSVRIEGLARWDDPECCVFEFNTADWTSGDLDDGIVPVFVLAGDLDSLRMEHSVAACLGPGCHDPKQRATQCAMEVKVFVEDISPGRHDVAIPPPIRTCQE